MLAQITIEGGKWQIVPFVSIDGERFNIWHIQYFESVFQRRDLIDLIDYNKTTPR